MSSFAVVTSQVAMNISAVEPHTVLHVRPKRHEMTAEAFRLQDELLQQPALWHHSANIEWYKPRCEEVSLLWIDIVVLESFTGALPKAGWIGEGKIAGTWNALSTIALVCLHLRLLNLTAGAIRCEVCAHAPVSEVELSLSIRFHQPAVRCC